MDSNIELLLFTWILFFITFLFAFTRVYARLQDTCGVWWEDGMMSFTLVILYGFKSITALILQVCCFAFSTVWTAYAYNGYAEHYSSLTPYEFSQAMQLSSVSQSLCVLGIASSQISICLLLQRMQAPHRWRTRVNWLLSGSICTVALPVVVLLSIQCTPSKIEYTVPPSNGTKQCLNQHSVHTYYVFANGKLRG